MGERTKARAYDMIDLWQRQTAAGGNGEEDLEPQGPSLSHMKRLQHEIL